MERILKRSIESINSLWHFYSVQKKYIDKKAKEGMKKNRLGFLTNYYFAMLTLGSEEDKQRPTFVNLEKAIKKHITVLESSREGVLYQIKDGKGLQNNDVSKDACEYTRFAEMPFIHGDNTLITLITRFEDFVSDYLSIVYLKYPKKYLDSKTITFSEISEMGVSSIKELILRREIDRTMRESFSSWFDTLEEHKLDFGICKNELCSLAEIYARRNIIVHNSGYVNESYISLSKATSATIGDRLFADDEYLCKAFSVVKTIVYSMLIEGVKFIDDNKPKYIESIFINVFDELCSGNYLTCITVYKALTKCKYADESIKLMSKVNLWISEIEINGIESVKKEISVLDTSALDKQFMLAKVTLLREYKKTTEIVEELLTKKELPYSAIESWPLFMHYRKTEEYKTFRSNHPELCGIKAVEPQNDSIVEDNRMANSIREELKTSLN